MKHTKKHAQHFAPHTKLPLGRSLAVLAAFFLVSLLGIQLLKASGFVTGSEAESGTVTGNAAKVNDPFASNGQSVRFGYAPGLPVPSGLQVYPGGDSIALNWDIPTSNPEINRYEVFRNGTRVATTTSTGSGAQKFGTQYIDTNVSPGQTYTYQVKAIGTDNKVSAPSNSVTVTQPTNKTPVPDIVIDPNTASVNPELYNWLRDFAAPIMRTWYPKVADMWVWPNYSVLHQITLTHHEDPNWEASAGVVGEGRIAFSQKYFKTQPDYSIGTALHEVVHVMQSPTVPVPGWFTEGIANYAKFYIMVSLPVANNEHIQPAQYEHYATDPYYAGARLIKHIDRDIDPTFIRRVMAAGHDGTFDASFLTVKGKSLDQIWSEYRGITIPESPIRSAINNRCIDVANADMSDGAKMQLWDCNDNIAQSISFAEMGDGTLGLVAVGKCLEVRGNQTAGSPVLLANCGKEADGKWVLGADGSLRSSVASDQCLDVPDGNAANGVQLRIWSCNGSNAQHWVVSNTVPRAKTGPISFRSNPGKCLDDPSGNTAAGTRLQVWDCNNLNPQRWVVRTDSGISQLSVMGVCLDIKNNGTANDTPVWLWPCSGINAGNKAQEWQIQSNGSLRNPQSGRCLDTASGSIANSAQFVIKDCNGSASQTFAFPN